MFIKKISSKGHPYYYNVLTGGSKWQSPTSIKGGGGMMSTPKLEPDENPEEAQFEEPQQDENPEEAKIASDLSDELLCPLSYAFMVDPVFLTSGKTYERKPIMSYFKIQTDRDRDIQLECPATKTPVTDVLTPNLQIRSMTDKFVEKYKDIKYIGPSWTEIRRLCSEYLEEQEPEKVEQRKRKNKQIEEEKRRIEREKEFIRRQENERHEAFQRRNREMRREANERLLEFRGRDEQRAIEQRAIEQRAIEQHRNEQRAIEQRAIEQHRNEQRAIQQRAIEQHRNMLIEQHRNAYPEQHMGEQRRNPQRARENAIEQEALSRPVDRMLLQVPRHPAIPVDVYERIRIAREKQDIYYDQDPRTTHERFQADIDSYLKSMFG